MQAVVQWLADHHPQIVEGLAELVAIPSISNDGQHAAEIDQSAQAIEAQMRRVGLQDVEILRYGDSYPYVYGEWLGAPGKPTVFCYAHHDVQPVNFREQWKSDPWKLTERDGRLYARGAADDKAAISLHLGVIDAYLSTHGRLPLNLKLLVEGEEEIGSRTLVGFFEKYRDKIMSDVIIVSDTGNLQTGVPSITYSLRGIAAAVVEVQGLDGPVHSGTGGGALPDAAIALDVILSRLYAKNGKIPIPGFYNKVRKLTPAERRGFRALPGSPATFRRDTGVLPGVKFALEKGLHPYEQTWRRPAVTVIAQEASSIQGASNQVLPKASAIVSVRTVPDQDSKQVFTALRRFLMQDPPWGVKVTVEPLGLPVSWWMTDPRGPAFEAAMESLQAGFKKKPVAVGCGGSIGFVGPLADLFGGVPALLLGIEDPKSNAHAPNESLHDGDFRKLLASVAHLYDRLGRLSKMK